METPIMETPQVSMPDTRETDPLRDLQQAEAALHAARTRARSLAMARYREAVNLCRAVGIQLPYDPPSASAEGPTQTQRRRAVTAATRIAMSAYQRQAWATLTPEQRQARVEAMQMGRRQAWATLTPEQRQARVEAMQMGRRRAKHTEDAAQ